MKNYLREMYQFEASPEYILSGILAERGINVFLNLVNLTGLLKKICYSFNYEAYFL